MDVSLSGQFALDMNSTMRLEAAAATRRDEALHEAAKQFEAIFIQKMLTAMRDASPKSGLLQSSQSDFYQSLMDQQWAQQIASEGMGLADQLVRQLGDGDRAEGAEPLMRDWNQPLVQPGSHGYHLPDLPRSRYSSPALDAILDTGLNDTAETTSEEKTFVHELYSHARTIEQETGIPADLMVAQAILETGWGKQPLVTETGSDSHNLFGIKAGQNWQGETVEATTHEYIGERLVEVRESFRAYPSYTESFRDYARLITENPRYAGVTEVASPVEAARTLQDGGYATDPDYAAKLISLIRQNLAMAGEG